MLFNTQDITYGTAITAAEIESDFRITTDTPYLALTGELWGVFCKDFREYSPRYNGTTVLQYLNEINIAQGQETSASLLCGCKNDFIKEWENYMPHLH